MSETGKVIEIPTASIRENPAALRQVNRQDEKYLGIVESMKVRGWFGAITVRERKDEETGEKFYELLDGLHRLTAAKDAGLEFVNADVRVADDAQALEIQILANVHKVDTKPFEYAKGLRRLFAHQPLLTAAQLGASLGKSTSWVSSILGLNNLPDKIGERVDAGDLNVSNAYALSKMTESDIADYLDRALTMNPDEFVPIANKRRKDVADAKRKGKDAAPQEFQPVAHLQKIGDIKSELEAASVSQALIASTGANTPQEGFALAIKWILHLDPESVKGQVAKHEERLAKKADAAKKAAVARAEKKEISAKKKMDEAAAASVEATAALSTPAQ